MTAPLEVLREKLRRIDICDAVAIDVGAETIRAAIAAIEERDAEIAKVRGGIAMMNECNAALVRDVDELRDQLATLARQLAEVKEENARVWAQLRAVDDTLNALGCSQTETFTRSAAIQRIADEREKWLTASRVLCAAHVGVPQQTCPVCQLAEMDKEASVQRERANGLEYACECAEKQRDAMRGALESFASEKCRTWPGVTMELKRLCESPMCFGCRARRALNALGAALAPEGDNA